MNGSIYGGHHTNNMHKVFAAMLLIVAVATSHEVITNACPSFLASGGTCYMSKEEAAALVGMLCLQ